MKKVENLLNQLLVNENLKEPNFDRMWQKIEMGGKDNYYMKKHHLKPFTKRRFAVLASIVLIIITVTPVMGYVSVNISDWMSSVNRQGVMVALENGFGQSIEERETHDGINFVVHNVVADDNRMVINYSFKLASNEAYNTAAFSKILLTNQQGKVIPGNDVTTFDSSLNQFVGYYETESLSSTRDHLTLTFKDISILKEKEQLIQVDWNRNEPQEYPSFIPGTEDFKITSIKKEDNRLIIDHQTKLKDEKERAYLYPSLYLQNGEQLLKPENSTVFPSENPILLHRREIYNIENHSLDKAKVSVKYLQETDVYNGDWTFAFDVMTDQLKESSAHIKLNQEVDLGGKTEDLKELVISPSQIIVKGKESLEHSLFGISYKDIIDYRKSYLEINGNTLEGGMFSSENHEIQYKFEPNQLISKIDGDITLILKDAGITHMLNPKDNTPFMINHISTKKQNIRYTLDGYPINISYQLIGKDLVVEMNSDNKRFGGISTVYYFKDGKRILVNLEFLGTFNENMNKTVATIKNVEQSEMKIYPYIYAEKEKDRMERIKLYHHSSDN